MGDIVWEIGVYSVGNYCTYGEVEYIYGEVEYIVWGSIVHI